MHQILFQLPFSGVTPGTHTTGGSAPRPPERGGRKGRERGGEGKGKEGRAGGVCVIAVGGGIDAPMTS